MPRKSRRLPLLIALLILVTIPFFFRYLPQSTNKIAPFAGQKILETHTLPGHPTVVVNMYGFLQAHAFSVTLIDTNKQSHEIFEKIEYMAPEGISSNLDDISFCSSMIPATQAGDGRPLYKVYWTRDGTRFAMLLQGHIVAVYDVSKGTSLRYQGKQYESFNGSARKLLAQ
jgi:hypothetical protein